MLGRPPPPGTSPGEPLTPLRLPMFLNLSIGVQSVAVGTAHVAVATTHGRVFTWGELEACLADSGFGRRAFSEPIFVSGALRDVRVGASGRRIDPTPSPNPTPAQVDVGQPRCRACRPRSTTKCNNDGTLSLSSLLPCSRAANLLIVVVAILGRHIKPSISNNVADLQCGRSAILCVRAQWTYPGPPLSADSAST